MKKDQTNNKGFTLVELLAVIVVLGIVLTIAVPGVTKLINKSKKNSFESSAQGLIQSAKYFYSDNGFLSNDDYTFSFEDGKTGEASTGERLKYSGEIPTLGRIILYQDGTIDINVCNENYCACKGSGTDVVFVVDKTIEICGVNEDGSTADNPIVSGQLVALEESIVALEDRIVVLEGATPDILESTYPVGSIYISVTNTNPGTLFGGTWIAWGSGRVPVGVNSVETEFDTVEETGGEKNHTLSNDEMPRHRHNLAQSNNDPNAYAFDLGVVRITSWVTDTSGRYWNKYTSYSGGSLPHNNLQPYITTYMWKRTE